MIHAHSMDTYRLIDSLRIGTLINPEHLKLLIPIHEESSSKKGEIWRIAKRIKLNPEVSIIRLANRNYKTRYILPGVSYFGKYLTVNFNFV
jgi:hypothetical protein